LKEYKKKKKKDIRLEFLEFGLDPDSESSKNSDSETNTKADIVPITLLPKLLKPPSSYIDCSTKLLAINDKIIVVLSSPSRRN
jgi:hypothetical protein